MKRALILIDYIYDFFDDDGALTAGESAQAIAIDIAEAINALTEDDVLIIANDCHTEEPAAYEWRDPQKLYQF